MATLVELQARLIELGANPIVASRAEVKYLPKIMLEGERIEEFVNGTYAGGFGLLIATNKRLLFIDKKLFDLLVDDIPYSMVSAVQFDVGFLWGRVTVYTRAKNFVFKRTRKERTLQFSRFVEEKMLKAQLNLMAKGDRS